MSVCVNNLEPDAWIPPGTRWSLGQAAEKKRKEKKCLSRPTIGMYLAWRVTNWAGLAGGETTCFLSCAQWVMKSISSTSFH